MIKVNLNDQQIKPSTNIKYLGITINKDNEYHNEVFQNSKCMEKSFYSLYNFGMKPGGVHPYTKAKALNMYCIPKITYGLGIRYLTKKAISQIDITINNIIRCSVGKGFYSHLTVVK